MTTISYNQMMTNEQKIRFQGIDHVFFGFDSWDFNKLLKSYGIDSMTSFNRSPNEHYVNTSSAFCEQVMTFTGPFSFLLKPKLVWIAALFSNYRFYDFDATSFHNFCFSVWIFFLHFWNFITLI